MNRALTRGAREVFRLGLRRLRDGIWSNDALVFMVRETAGTQVGKGPLVFRQAYPRDAKHYALRIGTDSPSSFIARLSESTRCFIVEHEELMIHASWVTTTAAWTRELRRLVVAPAGAAYVYESFTRSEARGLGVYPFALINICSRLAAERLGRAWVAGEEHNESSLRSISKAGFREAFRLPYRRRLGSLSVLPPTGPEASSAADLLPDLQ